MRVWDTALVVFSFACLYLNVSLAQPNYSRRLDASSNSTSTTSADAVEKIEDVKDVISTLKELQPGDLQTILLNAGFPANTSVSFIESLLNGLNNASSTFNGSSLHATLSNPDDPDLRSTDTFVQITDRYKRRYIAPQLGQLFAVTVESNIRRMMETTGARPQDSYPGVKYELEGNPRMYGNRLKYRISQRAIPLTWSMLLDSAALFSQWASEWRDDIPTCRMRLYYRGAGHAPRFITEAYFTVLGRPQVSSS